MTIDRLDPENRRRIARLLLGRPRRLAALNQHAPRWPDTIAQLDAQNRDTAAQAPILDKTCWHCLRPFETRKPHEGLCPACQVLADEDTRVIKWEG